MQQFQNNWRAALALPVAAADPELTIEPAQAALLGTLTPGDHYAATLARVVEGAETAWEVVHITAITGGVLTVQRGQEGTTALDWAAGEGISLRVTKGTLEALRGAVGPEGASAYQVAVANGFVGTEAEWLTSLQGTPGADGTNGADGASAYAVAVANGFIGTEAEWLVSLEGTDGTDGTNGADGASAYQVALANGFVGTEAQWLASLQGTDGTDGADGAGLNIVDELPGSGDLPATGNPGEGYIIAGDLWLWVDGAWLNTGPIRGPEGQSAYAIAVANGFVGTEAQWLASLQGAAGADGASAYAIAVANGFVGTEAQWLASLEGADGADGTNGTDGASAYQMAVANGFVGTEAEWLASLSATVQGLPSRTVTASGPVTPADAGHWLICDSATPITLTIGAEATASWAIAGILPMFHILQVGAGAVTITGDGFSVTLHATDTNVLDGAGAAAVALWRATNTWSLIGRLVAA